MKSASVKSLHLDSLRTLRFALPPRAMIACVLVLLFLFPACTDVDKIKQEAYDEGFKAGQQTKYADLATHFYDTPDLFVLNNTPHTSTVDPKSVVHRLAKNSQSEFNEIVFEVNQDILAGATAKLGMNQVQKDRAIEIYTQNHPKIANGYYTEYLDLCRKKELNRNLESFVDFKVYDRTDALTTVMSDQLCSTLAFVIGLLNLEFPAANIAGILAGRPCVELSNLLLKPFTDKLLESGFLQDIETSHLQIEQKASNMIMELASFEKQYNTHVSVTREEKAFWGLISSTATADAHYYGIVKAGFNLAEKLELSVDYQTRQIRLTLGEPKVFDPVIFPNLDKMENGLWATIDVNTINGMQIQATNQILNQAIADNILQEAEKNATAFLQMMFEPIASIPPIAFDVVVISGTSHQEIKIPQGIYQAPQ